MDDEKILDLYFARDERAVAETDRKYAAIASPSQIPFCTTTRTRRKP